MLINRDTQRWDSATFQQTFLSELMEGFKVRAGKLYRRASAQRGYWEPVLGDRITILRHRITVTLAIRMRESGKFIHPVAD